jgi:hypothetical protein
MLDSSIFVAEYCFDWQVYVLIYRRVLNALIFDSTFIAMTKQQNYKHC